ncbi:hypothetical protein CVT26_007897 [Gymnopilus dilepis]|uniref:F-box domain-containing protein n=1 Tax=Gymnopilus dilepis TaxID=231916 RepID=A0A409YKA9_9AGAR|nr:hypothetical protein CVT26_007897 [Gymnopilus dilepis]
MFIPLPSSDVCDQSSPRAVKIAQTVSRTWVNVDPSLWLTVPERITFHPDGKGTISSPYTVFSANGTKVETLSHQFKWRLARDGPLGMEDMDEDALFDTIPKLIRSEEAWTTRKWFGGLVPAYIRLELVGSMSSTSDLTYIMEPFMFDAENDSALPVEIVEYIFSLASEEDTTVNEVARVCRRSREMVMGRRRRALFPILASRFASNGITLWISCGHYNPSSDEIQSQTPLLYYALRAEVFKFPGPCGYTEPLGDGWEEGWTPRRVYYACPLRLPEKRGPTIWRRLHGDQAYDAHPEVEKSWI